MSNETREKLKAMLHQMMVDEYADGLDAGHAAGRKDGLEEALELVARAALATDNEEVRDQMDELADDILALKDKAP